MLPRNLLHDLLTSLRSSSHWPIGLQISVLCSFFMYLLSSYPLILDMALAAGG